MRMLLTSILFWAALIVLAAPVVAWFGPSVEQALFPVLGEQAVTVKRDGNTITFTNVVEKLRDCRMIEVTYSMARVRGDIVGFGATSLIERRYLSAI